MYYYKIVDSRGDLLEVKHNAYVRAYFLSFILSIFFCLPA